jgi:hypothetical protein
MYLVIFLGLVPVTGFPYSVLFLASGPLAVVVPLATLRVRRGRLVYLGYRHAIATTGAALFGVFFALLLYESYWRSAGYSLALVAGLLLLGGILSGWFAFGFQRWAIGQRVPRSPTMPPWDPRSWGARGLVGATFSWLSLIGLVGLAASFPVSGPTVLSALYGEVLGVFFLVAGLISVASEVATGKTRTVPSGQ